MEHFFYSHQFSFSIIVSKMGEDFVSHKTPPPPPLQDRQESKLLLVVIKNFGKMDRFNLCIEKN